MGQRLLAAVLGGVRTLLTKWRRGRVFLTTLRQHHCRRQHGLTFRYEQINAMLLNEFLKEHRTVQAQQREIDALRAELQEQRTLLQKVSDKVELSRPAPQVVVNKEQNYRAE
jgi:hypothetical protein